MITEKHFAASHSAFWRSLLPMAEDYIHIINKSLEAFSSPLPSTTAPSQRGVINELGCLLAADAQPRGGRPPDPRNPAVRRLHAKALKHLGQMRQFNRVPPPPLSDSDILEALAIAERVADFLRRADFGRATYSPLFRGCGWIEQCHGDIVAGNVLIEIKAGERSFRSLDIRQILVYGALNFSSKASDLKSICLMNPRRGNYFTMGLDLLCRHLSGHSAPEVLSAIVEYVSEPLPGFLPLQQPE